MRYLKFMTNPAIKNPQIRRGQKEFYSWSRRWPLIGANKYYVKNISDRYNMKIIQVMH